ncbi:MAG: DUF3108 domain-containing protein [Hyphomicrobiales bacterium]
MAKTALLIMALAAAAAAPAEAGSAVVAQYKVEAANTTILRALYQANIDGNSFTSSLSGKTAGISNFLKGVRLEMSAAGQMTGDGFLPGNFQNMKKKKHKDARTTGINWAADGTVKVITDKGAQPLPDGVAKALGKPSADPLTAILNIATMSAAKPCTGKLRVYDGKDVYDLGLALGAQVKLGGGKADGFRCTITYTPIAGRSFDQGEKDVDSYQAVFVPVVLNGASSPAYFPVQLVGKTMGVTYTVQAQSLTVDGAPQPVQ